MGRALPEAGDTPLERRILTLRGRRVMLDSVLNTPVAIQVSIEIVRAWFQMK